ncbi:MAG TPA: tripartite tricarboxylate transporter permease [Candidatus Methylomirabilis sp.]|nr:tripartite tricarboxylate transporter permease [Candidatus Methylomirabilis sp.]
MDVLHSLLTGFAVALKPVNLLFGTIGVVFGTFVGAMPGIGAPTGIAVLLPLTFGMDPTGGMIMLAGIYYGSQYGGTITSVLVNVPGESSSVVTCIDGHQMALKGRAGAALSVAAVGSFVAGTAGVITLMLIAAPVASFALKFGPPEEFALFLLAFTGLLTFGGSGSLGSDSRSKTLASIVLGLLVAMVGSDPLSGRTRWTFGSIELMGGIEFITVAVGLFGIGEVLCAFEENFQIDLLKASVRLRDVFPTMAEWAASVWPIVRGSVLGFVLGLFPGMGATIASFMSYALEKKVAREPERFGRGAIEAVAGPESANNSATAGAMVPLLTLGIPGTGSTAVMLGAFVIWGLRPGPLLFEKNPDFVWGLIASMYIGNLLLLILNVAFIPTFVRMLRIPFSILMASVVVFCVVGGYSLGNSLFDVWVMLAFGILGYVMKRLQIPQAPMLFAVVLGPQIEVSLRQALTMSHGSLWILVGSPISASLVTAAFLVFALPLAGPLVKRRARG